MQFIRCQLAGNQGQSQIDRAQDDAGKVELRVARFFDPVAQA